MRILGPREEAQDLLLQLYVFLHARLVYIYLQRLVRELARLRAYSLYIDRLPILLHRSLTLPG